jgi:hypothetical protein
MEETLALDVLEHPGFKAVLADIGREAKAARKVIFSGDVPFEIDRARGSLRVLQNIVLAVYRRANKEVPDNVKSLFE